MRYVNPHKGSKSRGSGSVSGTDRIGKTSAGFSSKTRWLRVACLVASAVSVTACQSSGSGGSAAASGASSLPTSALEGRTVAIVGPMAGDAYYSQVACGAKQEGRRLGLKVGEMQAASDQNQAAQSAIVTNVLATHPDALVYTPADGEAGGIPLKSAGDTTVINVDARLSDDALYTSFVASDHFAGSVELAGALADQIGGAGQIAAIGILPENPITAARIEGMQEGLKAFPDVELVKVAYPKFDVSAIQNEASSLLAKYPQLSGFYTTNYIIADAVGAALRQNDLVGKVKMATWDTNPVNVKLLQQGVATVAVAQQPAQMGKLAIEQIAAKLQGQTPEKEVVSPVSLVTNETVDTPEGKKFWYEGGEGGCS